jgi:hypothetical protein
LKKINYNRLLIAQIFIILSSLSLFVSIIVALSISEIYSTSVNNYLVHILGILCVIYNLFSVFKSKLIKKPHIIKNISYFDFISLAMHFSLFVIYIVTRDTQNIFRVASSFVFVSHCLCVFSIIHFWDIKVNKK